MKLQHVIKIGTFMGLLAFAFGVNAQLQMESLDRGIIAVNKETSVNYIGWRLLGPDSDTLGFNLYRITDGGSAQKLNPEPLTGATNFLDTSVVAGPVYQYFLAGVENGIETEISDTVSVWNQNYITLPLQRPAGGTVPGGSSYTYSPNDASAGDLDGDGQYEIVLKWDPSNSKDNSQSGYTGNVILDAYEMDGTRMWRIDLGINIRAGAHYTQFMVYDLDGDGKAEVACKTADGTTDGTGTVIGNASADYRNASGYILTGPEFLTVFDGETGAALATTDYIPARGNVGDWGDTYGNRVDRFLACVAYLDGQKPSLVMCRGYYTRTVLAAWDWREGSLTSRWVFDSNNGHPDYEGQGNHGISVADVDEDGKDEIVYGACAIDDDGSPLWTTGLGHGDAMHLADIMPDRPGLEKWGIHEGNGPGSALLDARTGEVLWLTANGDVGRGVSADLDSNFYGMECWGGTDGLRSGTNVRAGDSPSSSNHVVWWDGDLLRELLNDNNISKYGEGVVLLADGCSSNNGTKANPSLQADLFGDWREEVIWRTSDNNNLRIYTTTDLTEYRIKTLMHDPVYRLGIAWQNVAYNQPPHTGFFLGHSMFIPDSVRPPSAPRGLALSSTIESVKLEWNENPEGDLAGYYVYRSENMDGIYLVVTDTLVQTAEFTDTSNAIDLLYYYYVTALDTSGNESPPSETVMGASTLKPDWPTGVKAIKGNNSAYIAWDESQNLNVNGYNLYRSIETGTGYVKVNSGGLIQAAEFADTSLVNGTLYYYVVTAVDNESRESFYSDEVSIMPDADITLQAEDNVFENAWAESNHLGFHGTGFVNFDGSGSWLEFKGVYSEGNGWYYLVIRYALGNTSRTGNLVVNGTSQSHTMENTEAWTNWVYDSVKVQLVAGFGNTIRFETTGQDFGNVDEISVGSQTDAPPATAVTDRMSGLSSLITIAPNPFNRQTMISLSVSERSEISVELYNTLGQRVKTLAKDKEVSGKIEFAWSGDDQAGNRVSSGLYFCRIVIDGKQSVVMRILLAE